MYLFVIRHAVAEEREAFAKKNSEDSLRPLTIKGKKKLLKVIESLGSELKTIELIVTSPYTRSKETAQILSKKLGGKKIVESVELAPSAPPNAIVKWLKVHANNYKNVAIIGHEPHLSSFVSYLLSGQMKDSFIEIKKSSVVLLEVGGFEDLIAAHAKLIWAIPAKILSN